MKLPTCTTDHSPREIAAALTLDEFRELRASFAGRSRATFGGGKPGRSGRPGTPTACPLCGELCPSKSKAQAHCATGFHALRPGSQLSRALDALRAGCRTTHDIQERCRFSRLSTCGSYLRRLEKYGMARRVTPLRFDGSNQEGWEWEPNAAPAPQGRQINSPRREPLG